MSYQLCIIVAVFVDAIELRSIIFIHFRMWGPFVICCVCRDNELFVVCSHTIFSNASTRAKPPTQCDEMCVDIVCLLFYCISHCISLKLLPDSKKIKPSI